MPGLALEVIAGLVEQLDPCGPGSPLALAGVAPAADWADALEREGLIRDAQLADDFRHALAVLMWPEILIHVQDSELPAAAMWFGAGNDLVRYEQAQGKALISKPRTRDAMVSGLAAGVTTVQGREGEPEVLSASRWTLLGLDLVLRGDGDRDTALRNLATVLPENDDAEAALGLLVADELLFTDVAAVRPGRALDGWQQACDRRRHLVLQRVDIGERTPSSTDVGSLWFVGPVTERVIVLPQENDQVLLARPTVGEAETFIDAFLTPVDVVARDHIEALETAWRSSADALISGATGRP